MTRNRIILTTIAAFLFLFSALMLSILWSSNYQVTVLFVKIAIYYFLISSGIILIGSLKYKNKFGYISLIICLVVSFLVILPITFSSSNEWRTSAILFVNKKDKDLTIEYCSELDYNAKYEYSYLNTGNKAVIMRKKLNFWLEAIEEVNYNEYSSILRNEKDQWTTVDTIPTEFLYNMAPMNQR